VGRGMEGGVHYYSQKLIEVEYSLVVTAWERGYMYVVVESEMELTSTVICGPEVGVVVGPVEGERGEGGVPS